MYLLRLVKVARVAPTIMLVPVVPFPTGTSIGIMAAHFVETRELTLERRQRDFERSLC